MKKQLMKRRGCDDRGKKKGGNGRALYIAVGIGATIATILVKEFHEEIVDGVKNLMKPGSDKTTEAERWLDPDDPNL